MATEESPADASLEKVMPGVHQRLQAQLGMLNQLGDSVMTGFHEVKQQVSVGFCEMVEEQKQMLQEHSSLVLGATLVDAGKNLMNSPCRSVDSKRSVVSPDDPVAAPKPATSPPDLNSKPAATEIFVNAPRMKHKHDSLPSLFEEWFGVGEEEGIHGWNEKHGKVWRKAAGIDPSQYSRTHRLIVSIQQEAKRLKVQPLTVVQEWDAMFKASNNSVASFVKALQRLGKIPTKKPRGNKKEAVAAVTLH